MEQLQRIADGYRARAVNEHKAVEAVESGADPEATCPIPASWVPVFKNLTRSWETSELWLFNVPVSVKADLFFFVLIIFHQRHKTEYFLARLQAIRADDRYSTWIVETFTVNHLLGRVFVLGPADTILGIRSLAEISSYPVQIPRSEWASFEGTLFLPWVVHNIPPQSWIRLINHPPYSGDLAYVVGSSESTDDLVVAVVPRIRLPSRDISTQKGKRRKVENSGRTRRARLLPAFFDAEVMALRFGQKSVTTNTINNHADFTRFCVDTFVEEVATRDPDTNLIVMQKLSLDSGSFHLADISPRGTIHQFKGRFFYCGLQLLPIYAYRGVERLVVPPVDEIIPFAESCIDSVRINRLLSQLHWQLGDRVSHTSGIFQLEDIQLAAGFVSAVKIQHPPTEETAPRLAPVLLPANDLCRVFLSGDGVVAVAGPHKGVTGSVLRVEGGIVHLLTDDHGNYVSMFHFSAVLSLISLIRSQYASNGSLHFLRPEVHASMHLI